jgi:hypothetical protein
VSVIFHLAARAVWDRAGSARAYADLELSVLATSQAALFQHLRGLHEHG